MVQRRSPPNVSALTPKKVEEILQAAFDFSRAVDRANNGLSVNAAIRADNKRIVALVEKYCSEISGKPTPLENRPSTHPGWIKLQPPPVSLQNGQVRIKHEPHLTLPRYRVIWPGKPGGIVDLLYLPSPYGFQGDSVFSSQEHAEFWAKLIARTVKDKLEKE